jgi:glycolate oxidase FAD binding subunit
LATVDAALTNLAAIVGEDRVSDDPAARAFYAIDNILPDRVVYARGEEDIAAILKFAADRNLAVIPCRNSTKLHTGNPPRRYDIALSVKEMNEVWHYEPADLTVSAQPGMKLGDFEHFLGRQDLWIPLDPPGGAKSSLGGIVATNAAGPLRLRYGAPRDIVLGMKIATTEGKVIKTGGRVVKNVAGYDLAKLITGCYGTLGVIVEISFKLFPLPARRATWFLSTASLDVARVFRRRILDSPLSPMRMVLLDAGAASLSRGAPEVKQGNELEIWIEFGGSERVIQRCLETVQDLARAVGASGEVLDDLSSIRGWDHISDLGSTLREYFPQSVIVKAALPIDSNEEFLRFARDQCEKQAIQTACFSQNGIGIVHICLIPNDSSHISSAFIQELRNRAISLGGSLILERCPLEIKKEVDVWGPVGDDFMVMQKLKELWDPKGVLSPGRFVGGL